MSLSPSSASSTSSRDGSTSPPAEDVKIFTFTQKTNIRRGSKSLDATLKRLTEKFNTQNQDVQQPQPVAPTSVPEPVQPASVVPAPSTGSFNLSSLNSEQFNQLCVVSEFWRNMLMMSQNNVMTGQMNLPVNQQFNWNQTTLVNPVETPKSVVEGPKAKVDEPLVVLGDLLSGSSSTPKPKSEKKKAEKAVNECWCGKTFSNKYLLKKHLFTHSGLRPHLCQYCGKPFSRRDNMYRHERGHTKKMQQQQATSSAPTTPSPPMPTAVPDAASILAQFNGTDFISIAKALGYNI